MTSFIIWRVICRSGYKLTVTDLALPCIRPTPDSFN